MRGIVSMINVVPAVHTATHRQVLEKLLPIALLLLLCVPALTLRLSVSPAMWFDEGYKTNAARTLAERGVYGTYTINGYHPFDPGISSGPADIIPVALSFKLFDTGVAQARMVSVLYTLLGVVCLYAIARFIYGWMAGIFITVFLLAVPPIQEVSFLLVGRQALGEPPALALILLGLYLWFRSWTQESWWLGGLAGLVLGLGLLSKLQYGIALAPALGIIAVARSVQDRSRIALYLSPVLLMLGVVFGWSLLGGMLTPEAIQQENSAMLRDAIRSNLITGLFGRTLTKSAWAILVIMGIGGLAGTWRVWRQWRAQGRLMNAAWAEATLTLFVVGSALWFALLSVGWPRYAYAALTVSLLLVGKLGWDMFVVARKHLGKQWTGIDRYALPAALACLVGLVFLVAILPFLRIDTENYAQQTADYISARIPRDAVIETWEWELDALSAHWQYHHPHQRYLFLAIRQFSHEQRSFDLNYDMLQADPDYLITGGFSDWTRIYPQEQVRAHFAKVAEIGPYRIYERMRE